MSLGASFFKVRLLADKSERHRLTPCKNQQQNSGHEDFTKIAA
jgi:hypothetical protein